MGSLSYTIKEHFTFTPEELRALVIGILLTGFMFSFDEWGTTTFSLSEGLRNLVNAILIATLAFLVHQSAQRIVALSVGFKLEYRIWMYGIIIGLALTIVSRGKLWLLAPGGIIAYHLVGHRIGSFRYGLNYWPLGMIGLVGPLSNLVLAMVFKLLLLLAPTNVLLQQAMVFNIWFALFTILPIPPLDGSHLFFASRLMYMFMLGAVIGMSTALYFFGIFASIVLGIIFGVVCWLSYFWHFEKGS
ncbi:hypothetical protein HY488_03700 [Candidatus Woesearchaeota archaeon]|nr:hypothetical protein [Candidatus Woesearchaeota archaeon]